MFLIFCPIRAMEFSSISMSDHGNCNQRSTLNSSITISFILPMRTLRTHQTMSEWQIQELKLCAITSHFSSLNFFHYTMHLPSTGLANPVNHCFSSSMYYPNMGGRRVHFPTKWKHLKNCFRDAVLLCCLGCI